MRDTLALLDELYKDHPELPPLPPWAGRIDIARAEKISQARAERESEQLAKAISELLTSTNDLNEATEEITLQKVASNGQQPGEADSFVIAAGDETFEAPEELNELLGSMQLDFESLSIPASRATTGSQSYDPSAQPDSSDAAENAEPGPEETV